MDSIHVSTTLHLFAATLNRLNILDYLEKQTVTHERPETRCSGVSNQHTLRAHRSRASRCDIRRLSVEY